MRFYNELKFFIRFSLVFSILIDMLVGFEAVIRNNVYLLFLSCASIFAFIIPLYYVAYVFEKQKRQLDNTIRKSFNCVENMIKECDDDFESEFEKEIMNDKDMILFSEYINKNKKLFLEIKNKNNLLNEILISTVVNQDIEKFLADVMPKIMNITKSQFIVFYMANKITNKLEIKSSIGFGKGIYSQFDMSMSEGFLGQAAVNNKIMVIKDLDDDSVYVTKTFLGDIKPKNIIAVPINDVDDKNDILGVFAIGSVYEYSQKHIEILEEIRKYTAYAIINGVFYSKNIRLTNELKFQNQLIQNLNEDLEMKIKERTGLLNNIFNSMEEYAVISINTDEKIIMINDSAVKKFGVLKDDVIGKSIFEIPGIDDYIRSKTSYYIDEAIKKGKAKYIHNFDENGKEKIIETELFSIKDEYGEVSGITIVIKDMSYIKKINGSEIIEEKMLKIMLEESSNSLIIVKDDFTIEGISKNAEYLIGVNKDDVRGMFIWDIFSDGRKIKGFLNNIFNGSGDAEIKNFNTVAVNTKININMHVKLIDDSSTESKKIIMYL